MAYVDDRSRSRIFYVSNPDSEESSRYQPPQTSVQIRPLPPITTAAPFVRPLPNYSDSSSSRSSASASSPSPDTPDSPLASIPLSNGLSILAQGDGISWMDVDLSGAMDGAIIREMIYSTLKVPDEDFPITQVLAAHPKTRVPVGMPLTDAELLDICATRGAEGNLRLVLNTTSFSSAIAPPPPSAELPLLPPTSRLKSQELVIRDPPQDGYDGSDESSSKRSGIPARGGFARSPDRAPQSPPLTPQQLPGSRYGAPSSPSYTRGTSPGWQVPTRALPQMPTNSSTWNQHQRSPSDTQTPSESYVSPTWAGSPPPNAGDRLATGLAIPRSVSSHGPRAPDQWSSATSYESTSVRPPPRNESRDPIPISAQMQSSPSRDRRASPSVNSTSIAIKFAAPPSKPAPPPPSNKQPFQLPHFIHTAASSNNIAAAAAAQRNNIQFSGTSGEPRSEVIDGRQLASGNQQQQYSSYSHQTSQRPPFQQPIPITTNVNIESQRRPSAFSPLSPPSAIHQRSLVGARSFDNLRARGIRPLPYGPTPTPLSNAPYSPFRASPAPIQTSNFSPNQGSSSDSPSSAAGSPIGPLPTVTNGRLNQPRANLRRPNTADSGIPGLQRSGAQRGQQRPGTATGRLDPSSPPTGVQPAILSDNVRRSISRPLPPGPLLPPPAEKPPPPPKIDTAMESPLASPVYEIPDGVRDSDGGPMSAAGFAHMSAETVAKDFPSPLSPADDNTLHSSDRTWMATVMKSDLIHGNRQPVRDVIPIEDSGPQESGGSTTPKSHRSLANSWQIVSDEQFEEDDSASQHSGYSSSDDGTLWQRPQPSASASKPDLTPLNTQFKGDQAWLIRPQAEVLYDEIDRFFPEISLDEPVIESAPSPTNDLTQAFPPMSPTAAAAAGTMLSTTEGAPRDLQKNRKSIRVVADERRGKLKQIWKGGFSGKSDPKAAAVRRRTTKFWGKQVQELPPNATASNVPPVLSAISPSGTISDRPSKVAFQWARGALIGKGTYGRVYHALNATTGEIMAVKQVEMPKTASDQDDQRQLNMVGALKAESETLSKLDHPHVVQYLGFEETPDFLSIFLEYVPGGSIGGCMRRYGRFEPDVIKSFTLQVLEGLSYLHEVGILHRDLKGENILVDPQGVCKISDFGISRHTEDIYHNATHTVMQGSIYWMAPEVIANQQGYSAKIDVWSLGCVVLEMWAGRRPWSDQESMISVMFKLGTSKQAPPVPDDVELSELAEEFRQKCFAINPAERPTALELTKHPYLVLPSYWRFPGFQKTEPPPSPWTPLP